MIQPPETIMDDARETDLLNTARRLPSPAVKDCSIRVLPCSTVKYFVVLYNLRGAIVDYRR